MQIVNRNSIIEQQPRAFNKGTIECINDEWIFFDEEDDEAFLLIEEIHGSDVEVFLNNTWERVPVFKDEHTFYMSHNIFIPNGSLIRFRKKLIRSFDILLKELDDASFLDLLSLLKQADYSLFDCFFCHNSLDFQTTPLREGINFLLFDNQDHVGSLHHYYIRNHAVITNRFELTQTNGLKLFT